MQLGLNVAIVGSSMSNIFFFYRASEGTPSPTQPQENDRKNCARIWDWSS
jgi:hypothetical protein